MEFFYLVLFERLLDIGTSHALHISWKNYACGFYFKGRLSKAFRDSEKSLVPNNFIRLFTVIIEIQLKRSLQLSILNGVHFECKPETVLFKDVGYPHTFYGGKFEYVNVFL